VRAMQAAELQGDNADKLAQRWSDVTTLPLGRDERGRPTLALDDATLRFVSATDGRGEGLTGLDLACTGREGVLARARAHGLPLQGNVVTACGIRFRLVGSGAMRETVRLRLLRLRAADAAALVALDSDPEVMRYIGSRGGTLEQIIERARNRIESDHGALGWWLIETRPEGVFQGVAGAPPPPPSPDSEAPAPPPPPPSAPLPP